MPPNRAGGADDGARVKKHKHKSLAMLEKAESPKNFEKRTSAKTSVGKTVLIFSSVNF